MNGGLELGKKRLQSDYALEKASAVVSCQKTNCQLIPDN
jgi:hypothetical protein